VRAVSAAALFLAEGGDEVEEFPLDRDGDAPPPGSLKRQGNPAAR
jgi:hypothetical protein